MGGPGELAGSRPGERIYGTRAVGAATAATWHEGARPLDRRSSRVLGVTLENGTELIASGDHRFLTEPRLEARDGRRARSAAAPAPDGEQQAAGDGCVSPTRRARPPTTSADTCAASSAATATCAIPSTTPPGGRAQDVAPVPPRAHRSRGAAPGSAPTSHELERRDARVPSSRRRGSGTARCARSGRNRARHVEAIREIIAWPRPRAARLVQGLPRRDLRRRGLVRRRHRFGSATPIRRSSTGPRSPAGSSGSTFVVETAGRADMWNVRIRGGLERAAALPPPDRPGDHAQAD